MQTFYLVACRSLKSCFLKQPIERGEIIEITSNRPDLVRALMKVQRSSFTLCDGSEQIEATLELIDHQANRADMRRQKREEARAKSAEAEQAKQEDDSTLSDTAAALKAAGLSQSQVDAIATAGIVAVEDMIDNQDWRQACGLPADACDDLLARLGLVIDDDDAVDDDKPVIVEGIQPESSLDDPEAFAALLHAAGLHPRAIVALRDAEITTAAEMLDAVEADRQAVLNLWGIHAENLPTIVSACEQILGE